MYVSSLTAQCAYCSAHSCSFALRRGAQPETIALALDADGRPHTPSERAAIAVARSLASVPSRLTQAERQELERHFSPAHVEWIVLCIAIMGFLNKFMDAVGVELEEATAAEVRGLIGPTGWAPGKHLAGQAVTSGGAPPSADTLATKLSVFRHAPSALRLDRAWTAGVPNRWPQVGDYLRERTGHNFPVLSRLRHAKPIRAIAVVLRDNLDATTTVVGLTAKHLAGVIYATVVGDTALATELRKLAARSRISPETLDEIVRFATAVPTENPQADIARLVPSLKPDRRTHAGLLLVKAISPSPSQVDSSLVDTCRINGLDSVAIVELVVWISVLQMLHRLSNYYA
jgi:alkylhydroperoxidase family enzyme